MTIDFPKVIKRFDEMVARGFSTGIGDRNGQVCVEAAICYAMGLPHGDDPGCVALAVRSFKIALNDSYWSSPKARAKGLRNLGIAQLGSRGIVDNVEFSRRLAEKVIRVLIPKLFRETLHHDTLCLVAADRCEKEGTKVAVAAAARVAWAAAWAAADRCEKEGTKVAVAAAARAARAAWAVARAVAAAEVAARAVGTAVAAARAAEVAARAAWAATLKNAFKKDKYLLLVASLALEVLQELKSPGCEWLEK